MDTLKCLLGATVCGLTLLATDDPRRTRCEIWTRVMGYHRPVSSFNTGKQGEFHQRQFFREPAAR